MTQQPLLSLGIILCLTFAFSESLPGPRLHASSSKIPIQTQENGEPSAFVLSMKITNRIYDQSLEDLTSNYCENLWAEVTTLLEQIFTNQEFATSDIYAGVANIAFSKGSVIANATLVFNTQSINGDIVKFTFYNEILYNSDLQTTLTMDASYTLNLPPPPMVEVE